MSDEIEIAHMTASWCYNDEDINENPNSLNGFIDLFEHIKNELEDSNRTYEQYKNLLLFNNLRIDYLKKFSEYIIKIRNDKEFFQYEMTHSYNFRYDLYDLKVDLSKLCKAYRKNIEKCKKKRIVQNKNIDDIENILKQMENEKFWGYIT